MAAPAAAALLVAPRCGARDFSPTLGASNNYLFSFLRAGRWSRSAAPFGKLIPSNCANILAGRSLPARRGEILMTRQRRIVGCKPGPVAPHSNFVKI